MKRFLLFSLMILIIPAFSYAASIGGAETQGKGKFSIGMDEEIVFDRDFKDITLNDGRAYTGTITVIPGSDGVPIGLDVTGAKGDTKNKTNIDNMSRPMIKLSYGVLDNLDLFVRLGEANFKQKIKGEQVDTGTFVDPGSDNSGTYSGVIENKGTFTGKSALAWGLGAKGVMPLKNDWSLGMQAQYLTHRNSIKAKMTSKETGTATVTAGTNEGETTSYESAEEEMNWNAKTTVQEWQIAPYIAKKIGNFIPYFGVKYSDMRGQYKDEDSKIKFKADDNFGVFLGTDFKLGDKFSLNLEGRFIDETAMSVGATYRF